MERMTPTLWFIIGLALVVLEMVVPGFVIVWFGVGAIAAGLAALFLHDPWVQLGVFVVVSGLLVVLSQQIARRITKPEPEPVGANRMQQARGIVTVDIRPPETGRVKVLGEEWRAESQKPIAAGTEVIVTAVSGTRLIVEPLEERSQ